MTALGEAYLWCGLQVTLLATAGALLYGLLHRQPCLRAALPQWCLAMVLILSLLAVSPWPSWPWLHDSLNRKTERTQTHFLGSSSKFNRELFASQGNRLVRIESAGQAEKFSAQALDQAPTAKAATQANIIEPSNSRPWKNYFLILAGGSCSLAAVRLLCAWRTLHNRIRTSGLIDASRLPAEFTELRRQYDLMRPVVLRESLQEDMPATVGWQRPSILLPPSWRTWTSAQRRAVLAHELAHIEHHDFATLLAVQWPLLLHSYHPLVHWLTRRLRWEQEISADRRAIEVLGDREGYMAALAELALRQPTTPQTRHAYALAPTSSMLLRRLQMLRQHHTHKVRSASPFPRAVLLASLATVLLAVVGLRQKATAQPGNETPAATSAEPVVNGAPVIVTALVILSPPPTDIGGSDDGGSDARAFWETQISLIKSPYVLETALALPEVAESRLFETAREPINWLSNRLEVSRIPESPVLKIRLPCPAGEAAAAIRIVDRITRKYQSEVALQKYFSGSLLEDTRQKLAALHKDLSAELQEKITKYQTITDKLGGAEAKISTTMLNLLINEVRQIQTQIMKKKEDLVEISVNRAIAEQQARSTTAMKQAVAEELDKDPMLASFKADEYAYMQQIRALKTAEQKDDASQIEKLQSGLEQLKQDAHQYRMETEAAIRKDLKAAPSDFLSTVMMEYQLRKGNILAEIAKLEAKYEDKVSAIEQKGNSPRELSMLESEIQQLQKIESEMGDKLRHWSSNNRSTESAIKATVLLPATITSNHTMHQQSSSNVP